MRGDILKLVKDAGSDLASGTKRVGSMIDMALTPKTAQASTNTYNINPTGNYIDIPNWKGDFAAYNFVQYQDDEEDSTISQIQNYQKNGLRIQANPHDRSSANPADKYASYTLSYDPGVYRIDFQEGDGSRPTDKIRFVSGEDHEDYVDNHLNMMPSKKRNLKRYYADGSLTFDHKFWDVNYQRNMGVR